MRSSAVVQVAATKISLHQGAGEKRHATSALTKTRHCICRVARLGWDSRLGSNRSRRASARFRSSTDEQYRQNFLTYRLPSSPDRRNHRAWQMSLADFKTAQISYSEQRTHDLTPLYASLARPTARVTADARPALIPKTIHHGSSKHLNHASRHEASNRYALGPVDWPDHGPPSLVRLSDDGLVRDFDPNHVFRAGGLRHAHPIVTVRRHPIGVFNNIAVSE